MAITENATAHSSVKPKFPPASVAVVTVPGPIKAAATMAPGPKCCRVLLMSVSEVPSDFVVYPVYPEPSDAEKCRCADESSAFRWVLV